ncbi:MarR family winged helix-turn-helix transcriptional regulator [Calidifontibacter terrae]
MHDFWSESDPRVAALQQLTRTCVNLATQTAEAQGAVSLPQMRLLLTVAGNPGVSCADLGHELAISASAISRMADRLVETGHLQRERSSASRRVVVLELTDHGQECVRAVLSHRAAIFERALDALGDSAEQILRSAELLAPALHTELTGEAAQ